MLYEKYGYPMSGTVKQIFDDGSILLYIPKYTLNKKAKFYGISCSKEKRSKEYLISTIKNKSIKIIPVEMSESDLLIFGFYENNSINEKIIIDGRATIDYNNCNDEFLQHLTHLTSDTQTDQNIPKYSVDQVGMESDYLNGIYESGNIEFKGHKIWTSSDYKTPTFQVEKPKEDFHPPCAFSLWLDYIFTNHQCLAWFCFPWVMIIIIFVLVALVKLIF